VEEENGNAHRGQSALPYITVTITDRADFRVQVSGTFPNLDYALHMLDQAHRELEAQWRLQRAQLQLQKAADEQLAKALMSRR
jgi:hypothetical protein